MNPSALKTKCALALFIAGLLGAGSVMADKPEWAGGKGKGKGNQHERADRRGDDDKGGHGKHSGKRHFEERHTTVVHEYYGEQFRGGRCPPGLAKKRNGCMPPGQAKKWQVGRPLPREVVYYEVPRPLLVQLGAPPAGHRYVRVGGDILLLTTGKAIVVDAIQYLASR
jgi:Ni/Co efflux regulator RcnB